MLFLSQPGSALPRLSFEQLRDAGLHAAEQGRLDEALELCDKALAAARQREGIVAAAQIAMGAIRSKNLVIAYQPVVSAQGNNRAAFHECLVRVREPSGELITAAAFMPDRRWPKQPRPRFWTARLPTGRK